MQSPAQCPNIGAPGFKLLDRHLFWHAWRNIRLRLHNLLPLVWSTVTQPRNNLTQALVIYAELQAACDTNSLLMHGCTQSITDCLHGNRVLLIFTIRPARLQMSVPMALVGNYQPSSHVCKSNACADKAVSLTAPALLLQTVRRFWGLLLKNADISRLG